MGITQQNYKAQANGDCFDEICPGTISVRLTSDDLMKMRFTYSPLLEVITSYRHLVYPKSQARYWQWIEEVRHNLHGIEFPYLDAY